MSDGSAQAAGVAPISLGADEGEALWFMGALVTMKASAESTGGALAVIEQLAPRGVGSPLHVHEREDEWFHILEGTMTFWVGGTVIEAGAGSFVFAPRGIPHTFVVSSETARCLLATHPGDFGDFVRRLAVPAERREIPPAPDGPPDMAAVMAAAADYGIQIIGPPGIPA